MSSSSSSPTRYHYAAQTDRLRRSFAVACIAVVCFVALLRGTGYTSSDIADHAEHVASNFGLQGHLHKITDLAWNRKDDSKKTSKYRITLIVMWCVYILLIASTAKLIVGLAREGRTHTQRHTFPHSSAPQSTMQML